MNFNPKISVIMPVLLSYRIGQTKNPASKFKRAIHSFLSNDYHNKELVVISDGCSVANKIVINEFKPFLKSGLIKLIRLPKREDESFFIGSTRQSGIDAASGDIICNLDADDTIEKFHLKNLASSFDLNLEWVYFNLYRKLDSLNGIEEIIDTQPNTDSLCTASVSWRRDLNISWTGANGKMDNKIFNQKLIDGFKNVKKIYGLGYCIRHANFNYSR